MALPKTPLERDTVKTGGHVYEIRQLSGGEEAHMASIADDFSALQTWVLSRGLGESLEDTAAWEAETPGTVVREVRDRIMALSHLTEDADRPTSGT